MMSAAPRVLIVSHGHPAHSLGGAEVASYNLHKGLKAHGVGSTYLARTGAPVPRHGGSALMSLRQGSDEILYHADDYDHFLLSNRSTDELDRDFVRVLRRLRPDVVHFHHLIGLGLEALYATRQALPDARILLTIHEYLLICHHHGQMVKRQGGLCSRATPADCHACFPEIAPARFLQRERLAQGMLDVVDAFVSPSRFLARRFVEWGLPEHRIVVIENGLDVAEAAPPRPLPAGGRRSRFAYFGQMTPSKGVDVFLDAIARIPEPLWGPDSRAMIFGANLERQPEAYRARIARLIEAAGDRVAFYGSYQNIEMPRLMRSADWAVVPSTWWENSPVVIQEAFFHGRPLITSALGGMAEKVRDGVDGLTFRAGSAEDLADCLVQALSEPELWQRLRDGRPAPLTHLACAEAHLTLYRSLLARGEDTQLRLPALAAAV